MVHPVFESAQIIFAVAMLVSALGGAVAKIILALKWGQASQPGLVRKMAAATVAKSIGGQKNDDKAA